jgi:2,3-bisphosphoglycerate-independent phosphoglycerate mutase
VECNIGRGVLEAVGIDIELQPGDVAARGNFCTIDEKGIITDRRAGRISNEKCIELCRILDGMSIDGVQIIVYPVREHRFVVIFRGDNLEPDITESDPSKTGVIPSEIIPINEPSARMADIARRFVEKAGSLLAEHHPANMVLMRGFAKKPQFPVMQDIYKLNPLAIAVYPMYRGLARLVGMEIATTGTTIEDEFETLRQNFDSYDFFFIHIKWTDTAGEDSDFQRKVKVLENVDTSLPVATGLGADVLVITGDHSTPALLGSHSWHSVPVLICSQYCRKDAIQSFSEPAFLAGGLGRIPSTQIITLAMANAQKFTKFGA